MPLQCHIILRLPREHIVETRSYVGFGCREFIAREGAQQRHFPVGLAYDLTHTGKIGIPDERGEEPGPKVTLH